jgi:hypothetical protein
MADIDIPVLPTPEDILAVAMALRERHLVVLDTVEVGMCNLLRTDDECVDFTWRWRTEAGRVKTLWLTIEADTFVFNHAKNHATNIRPWTDVNDTNACALQIATEFFPLVPGITLELSDA